MDFGRESKMAAVRVLKRPFFCLFVYLKDPHYLVSMTPVTLPGVQLLAIYMLMIVRH